MAVFDYNTFPQPLIGLHSNLRHSLGCVISWMIVNYADRWDQGMVGGEEIDPNEARKKDLIHDSSFQYYLESKSRFKSHLCGHLVAADMFGVVLGAPDRTEQEAMEAQRYIDQLKSSGIGIPRVSLQKDVFWELRNGTFNNEAIGRCLIAIRSILGEKPFIRITYDLIRIRANGGVGRGFQQGDIKPLLSYKQVRTSVEKLIDRGFMRCVVVGNRHRYYSTRLDEQSLVKAIEKHRAKRLGSPRRKAIKI